MMPGMGGAPGGAGSAHERSDASGLLGGVVAPWIGAGLPGGAVGEPGATAGAAAGGPGLDEQVPVGSDGLPLTGPLPAEAVTEAGAGPAGLGGMPMMPGAGAAGAAGGAPERSDAAGLVGGVTEPWSDGELGDGEPVRRPGPRASG